MIRMASSRAGLRRAGRETLISASPKIAEGRHAALPACSTTGASWLEAAEIRRHRSFLRAKISPWPKACSQDVRRPLVAIHPGSGGERKNWPLAGWLAVQKKILEDDAHRSPADHRRRERLAATCEMKLTVGRNVRASWKTCRFRSLGLSSRNVHSSSATIAASPISRPQRDLRVCFSLGRPIRKFGARRTAESACFVPQAANFRIWKLPRSLPESTSSSTMGF